MHTCTGRHGVCGNICSKLSKGKCCSDNEHAKASGAVGTNEEFTQKVKWVPNRLAVDDCGRRRTNDANKGGHGKADWDGEKL